MTPQELKAMKLALEALKLLTGAWQTFDALDYGDNAIAALEEVLAEHAMREVQRLGQEIEQKIGCVNHDCDQCKAQPEQEPVACKTLCELCVKRGYTFCANAVKTTHIYTTPPQRTEQEPVAWRTFDGEGGYDYRSYEDNESYADEWDKRNPNHKDWVDKLYTTPPPCPTCEALARTVMMDQTGRDA